MERYKLRLRKRVEAPSLFNAAPDKLDEKERTEYVCAPKLSISRINQSRLSPRGLTYLPTDIKNSTNDLLKQRPTCNGNPKWAFKQTIDPT